MPGEMSSIPRLSRQNNGTTATQLPHGQLQHGILQAQQHMSRRQWQQVGVTKPEHFLIIKAQITKLNLSEGLPDFIPGRLEDWLSLLGLKEYTALLKQQKYVSVVQTTQLTWEDLEDFGIIKLGHQKLMLAIKRVKDTIAGKNFTTCQQPVYRAHDTKITCACEGREQFNGVPELQSFVAPGPKPQARPAHSCPRSGKVQYWPAVAAGQIRHDGGGHRTRSLACT
ncbi:uncharacterized protein LOC123500569 [Portunus trituberculatus]|uniref:uncharacterized protein LOC123500569 n=1 Tax=Portunus trituberculatus TaxID=210409 RepID=UPI001E1D1507|nr:uncharacterized protein LOC123500569 [Portunus trituberculatus]